MNVQAEHVHLVVWIPPKYAVSEVIGYLKGKLAIKLFQRFNWLRKKLWGNHLLQSRLLRQHDWDRRRADSAIRPVARGKRARNRKVSRKTIQGG